MVIKGNPAGNVMFWSKHLQREDTNERVEVKEIKGVTAGNLQDALWEMKWVAAGSRSEGNFMYQANVNLPAHEHLTEKQWVEVFDMLEKNLGLEGHQRVVVEHEKEGRVHRHAVWNRVDVETMRVADMGGNWRIHAATARELEQRFDLTRTPDPGQKNRSAAELYEYRAGERSGIHPADVTREVTALWQSTDSGKAFAAALEQHGYVLAQGDRRDFCIVDKAGDAHSLARRIDGVNTTELRARMVDVDRDNLPTVAAASAQQRGQEIAARQNARDEIREAYAGSETPQQFRAALEAKGYALAQADAVDVERSKVAQSHAVTRGEYRSVLKEGQFVAVGGAGQVYTLNQATTGERPKDVSAFLRSIDKEGIPSIAEAVGERVSEMDMVVTEGPDRSMSERFESAIAPALDVVDGLTGVVEKLTTFVTDLLIGGVAAPSRKPSEQVIAERRASAAIDNIRESVDQGRAIDANDLRSLLPEHLQSISEKGDDYVRALVEQVKEDRQRRRDEGWHRER